MDSLAVFSVIGTATAVLANLISILSVQQQILMNKKDQIPESFLYFNHVSQVIWLIYALRINLFGLIVVNFLTSLLSFVSVLILKRSNKGLIAFLPSYLFTITFTVLLCGFLISSQNLGKVGSLFAIFSAGSTQESVVKVFKSGLHSYIDLKVATLILLCGLSWGIYGFLANDKSVLFTNFFWTLAGISLVFTHLAHKPFRIRGSTQVLIEYLKSKFLPHRYLFII